MSDHASAVPEPAPPTVTRFPGPRADGPGLGTIALVAAQLGADAIRAVVRGGDLQVATKRDDRDLVTAADHASDAAIHEVVTTTRPRDGWRSEESGDRPGTTGVTWVVDPLDGTLNFVHRRGDYAVSIGVERDGTYVAGALVRPATGEWLVAEGGEIRAGHGTPGVTGTTTPRAAMFALGFPGDERLRPAVLGVLGDLLPVSRDFRRSGSSACELMDVALGRLDVYLGYDVHDWDVAAGMAVVRAAGGHADWVETESGVPLLVAGTPAVLDPYLRRAARV